MAREVFDRLRNLKRKITEIVVWLYAPVYYYSQCHVWPIRLLLLEKLAEISTQFSLCLLHRSSLLILGYIVGLY